MTDRNQAWVYVEFMLPVPLSMANGGLPEETMKCSHQIFSKKTISSPSFGCPPLDSPGTVKWPLTTKGSFWDQEASTPSSSTLILRLSPTRDALTPTELTQPADWSERRKMAMKSLWLASKHLGMTWWATAHKADINLKHLQFGNWPLDSWTAYQWLSSMGSRRSTGGHFSHRRWR